MAILKPPAATYRHLVYLTKIQTSTVEIYGGLFYDWILDIGYFYYWQPFITHSSPDCIFLQRNV